MTLTVEEQLHLINDNLEEVLNPEIIEEILKKGDKPVVYWGTAYLVPAVKIAQLLQAGCDVIVLIADVHGYLDAQKSPVDLVAQRTTYYQFAIAAILEAVGAPIANLKFVLGSDYQEGKRYVRDLLRMSTFVSLNAAKRAGAEIVKQSADAPLSTQIYPLMQVLDEEHLSVDAQLGGMDQRKLFTAATEWLPKMGYRKRAHFINPLIPGLAAGGKMSSSDPNSKIDLLEASDVVAKKIKKAFAVPKVSQDNGLIAMIEYVFLPAEGLKGKKEYVVDRPNESSLVYPSIDQVKKDYEADVLTPQLLKNSVAKYLNQTLDSVRAKFDNSKEWQDCVDKAYPVAVAPKKEKKDKGRGTMFPGGTKDKLPQRPKKDQAKADEAKEGETAKVPTPAPEPPKPS